jgi:hypothetical protein
MQHQKKILYAFMVLGVLFLMTLAVFLIKGRAPFVIKLPTELVSSKFKLIHENSFKIQDKGKLELNLGVSGASSESGNGVSGMAIEIDNLPDFLSNPKIVSNVKNWTTNVGEIKNDAVLFTARGDGSDDQVLKENTSSVITISFDVATAADYDLNLNVEIVNNSIPNASYLINNEKISLTKSNTESSDFSIITDDSVKITSKSSFEIPIGISGAGTTDAKKVNTFKINVSGLPSYVESCDLKSNDSDWTVSMSNASAGKFTLLATGSSDPLTKDVSSLVSISCKTGTISSSVSDKVILAGELTTLEKSEIFKLPDKNVTLTLSSDSNSSKSYGISGYVSGDIVKDVSVSCGSYTATTNSAGYFEIANLPNGTSCSLLPSKTGYTFSPSSISVTLSGSSVTGKNFTASASSSSSSKSISGTISGDTKNAVLLSCGSHSAVSNSSGNYSITGISQGTSCTLVPLKSGYTFSPEAKSITIGSTDLTAINFKASVIKGEKGDKGDDGDDGDDGKSTTTTTTTTKKTAVAPKSGPAENFIIAVAIFMGLSGAVVFIGKKLGWFA